MKCPMCTAIVPVPANYKAESVFAPTAEPEAEPPVDEAPEPSANHAYTNPAPVAFTPDVGFLAKPEPAFMEPTPAPPPSDSRTERESAPSGESLTIAWLVFAVSAALFVGLLVLWGLAESGAFD